MRGVRRYLRQTVMDNRHTLVGTACPVAGIGRIADHLARNIPVINAGNGGAGRFRPVGCVLPEASGAAGPEQGVRMKRRKHTKKENHSDNALMDSRLGHESEVAVRRIVFESLGQLFGRWMIRRPANLLQKCGFNPFHRTPPSMGGQRAAARQPLRTASGNGAI